MHGTKTGIDQLVSYICSGEPLFMDTLKGRLVDAYNQRHNTNFSSFDDAIGNPEVYKVLYEDVANTLRRK